MSRMKWTDKPTFRRDRTPPTAPVTDPCSAYYNNLYLTLVPTTVRNSHRRQRKAASSSAPGLITRRASHRQSRSLSPTNATVTGSAGQKLPPTLHHCPTSLTTAPSRHHWTQSSVPRLGITALNAQATHPLPLCQTRVRRGIDSSRYIVPCSQRPEVPAMCNAIPDTVKDVVRDVMPRATVLGFERISTTTLLRRLSEVRISEVDAEGEVGERKLERKLIVSLPPAPSLRLLRSEHWLFGSEASILDYLWEELEGVGVVTHSDTGEVVRSDAGEDSIVNEEDESNLESTHASQETLRFIPQLWRHHPDSSSPIGGPYSVLSCIPGAAIATLPPSITDHDKTSIGQELGSLMAQLAEVLSPCDKFGPAMAVLSPPDVEQLRVGAQGMQYTGGADDWRTAFHSYLESVLRDGEDLHINLPYAAMRAQMQRLGDSMSGIVTPRLLIVDPGEDGIYFVKDDRESPSSDGTKNKSDGEKRLKFSGLTNLSTAFFGDPLLCTIFAGDPEPPSKSFLQGFTGLSDVEPRDASTWHTELIEDPANGPARMLLYRALHATVAVVREYFRPAPDSSKRELTARKRLSEALEKLEGMKVFATGGVALPPAATRVTTAASVEGRRGITPSMEFRKDLQQRRPRGVVLSLAKRARVDD